MNRGCHDQSPREELSIARVGELFQRNAREQGVPHRPLKLRCGELTSVAIHSAFWR
jgi:hypothetical protein